MFDDLYKNIGGKLKDFAKVAFIISAIGAIITGFIFLISLGMEDGWWALFIIVFGPVVALASSWILYAFGELVEDVSNLRLIHNNVQVLANPLILENNAKREAEEKVIREAEEKAKHETAKANGNDVFKNTFEYWVCSCGCRNNASDSRCSNCYRNRNPQK